MCRRPDLMVMTELLGSEWSPRVSYSSWVPKRPPQTWTRIFRDSEEEEEEGLMFQGASTVTQKSGC